MKTKLNNPELLNFKLVNFGNVRALATIRVNGFIIKNIKIIQEKNKKPYFRLPETSFIKDGKTIYTHLFEIEDIELKREINKLLLFAYFKEKIEKEKEKIPLTKKTKDRRNEQ